MTNHRLPITDYRLPASVFWRGRRVFITGHTGFKGSWLAFWLQKLGADVYGYSLKPPTKPNHYSLLKLDINSKTGDICNLKKLKDAMSAAKPEIVFHLAAQSLVRLSYEQPVDTFSTNVMGTLNVFEACRQTPSVRAIINVTSDKCYENRELDIRYREGDPLGGHDPYSASKGCSEILTNSYRRSYFNNDSYGANHGTLLASCRAGNVIGGGDWAEDRLIPDIMRAAKDGKPACIRNPKSIRPWQHVLEPLAGYMLLGQELLEGKREFADAWNFGPVNGNSMSVEEVVKRVCRFWEKIEYTIPKSSRNVHEANILKIDSSKARIKLKWIPRWDAAKALETTAQWYRNYYENGVINTGSNIVEYEKEAVEAVERCL